MVFLLMGGAYLRSRIKQAGKWDQETIVSFFLCQYCSGEYLRVNEVRLTPFMFNSRFRIPKRQLQSKPASCIAFWFIATPKAVHLLPESLQRF
jgi:hypothetical protein